MVKHRAAVPLTHRAMRIAPRKRQDGGQAGRGHGGHVCLRLRADPDLQAHLRATGINILSLSERQVPGNGTAGKDVRCPRNTQVDTLRTITVEFDANARGPWDFKPAQRSCRCIPAS
jgi:hypothetical protein